MATMSPTEAKDAAWKDLMKGLGLDMLGGFLSGGLMAGAPNFARVASYSNEMNVLAGQTFTAQGLLNTAVNLGVQGDTVAKVSKAVADGKSVSNATMHALAVEVAKKSLQSSMPQVTSTIAEQLSYAQSAPSELNISTLEYIVTKPDTKSFVSDVDNHPKYVAAVGIGLTVEQYTDLKANIDANGNGSTSQAEAKAYLDSTDLSREQKAAAWYIINKGWKKNPYGSLTSENKAILDNLYGTGWQDKK